MIIKDFDLDDVFLLSEILDKMELEVNIDRIAKESNIENIEKLEDLQDAASFGKEVMLAVLTELFTKVFIRKLYKAKKEVKQLICNFTGLDEAKVSKMNLKDMKAFFKELTEKEGFSDFLKQAGESIKQE